MSRFWRSLLLVGVLTLRANPAHADLKLSSEDHARLKELLAGYEASKEQAISRAIDLLLTPNGIEQMIEKKQNAEARPRLEQIQEQITGARVETEGFQERILHSRPFSWRDGHFLDDYSLQTSSEYVARIAAQYRRSLIYFLRQQGALNSDSPVSERIRQDIQQVNRAACQVLKNL